MPNANMSCMTVGLPEEVWQRKPHLLYRDDREAMCDNLPDFKTQLVVTTLRNSIVTNVFAIMLQ